MPDTQREIRITYEDKELLSSGSFITYGPGETAIDAYLDGDHLRFLVQFSGEERDVSKQAVEASYPDQETLKLHFLNYNNIHGSHQAEPHEVGTIANRRIWLAYRVVELQGSDSKHFTYSLYVGPELADG